MFFFFKIPIVKASENVGEHLQDHLTTMLGPFFVNQPIVFDIVKFFTPAVVWEFLSKGTGKDELSLSINMFIFRIFYIVIGFKVLVLINLSSPQYPNVCVNQPHRLKRFSKIVIK